MMGERGGDAACSGPSPAAQIDRFLDLGELRAHLGSYYSDIGRPLIGPELMVRMLIIGYCFGASSERRLCDEVHLNLTNRRFYRLGLDGDVPDHSPFSKNRHGRLHSLGCLAYDRDVLDADRVAPDTHAGGVPNRVSDRANRA